MQNMQDTRRTTGRDHNNVWKGLAAGLIGGLVASWTMNRFQDVWFKIAKGIETSPGNQFQSAGGEQAAASWPLTVSDASLRPIQ